MSDYITSEDVRRCATEYDISLTEAWRFLYVQKYRNKVYNAQTLDDLKDVLLFVLNELEKI